MKIKTPHCARSSFSDRNRRIFAADGRQPAPGPAGLFRKTVLSLLVGSMFAIGPVAAYAFEAKVSGQVNRALMWVDDDTVSEIHHVDNDNSGTRFRFTGTGVDVMPGVKARGTVRSRISIERIE